MEVEIIRIQAESNPLDPTIHFGIALKKIHSSIQLLHWYTTNYNVHKILGDLYEDLDNLFDKLQEEIIGTSKIQNTLFPHIEINLNFEDINYYNKSEEDILLFYKKINETIQNLLTSLEFNNYISSVKSGINNTKEEIITSFNKTNYLLSLVNF